MTALNDRITAAIGEGRVRAGGLLFVEISSQGDTRTQGNANERAFVTADMPPPALAQFLQNPERASISTEVLNASAFGGCAAWVLSYQAGTSRHSVLIPLVGSPAARLIDSASHSQAVLVFTSCEEEDIEAVVEVPLSLSRLDLSLIGHQWRARVSRAALEGLLQSIDTILSRVEQAPASADGSANLLSVVLHGGVDRALLSSLPCLSPDG